jgi:flagellar motor protein MotB
MEQNATELARQPYRQAERLLNEAVRQQQDGNSWQSYYLALRAQAQGDVARSTALAAQAERRLNLARQGYIEVQLEHASLRVETAETLLTVANARRALSEADAQKARTEASRSEENASTTLRESAAAIERNRAETEMDKARLLLKLADEVEAATYAKEGLNEATHLLDEANRLLSEGDARTARLKAMDAVRIADEARITATTRRDVDRQRREQERYTKGNAASAEIGKATLLVESARRLGAAQHAKTTFDQAVNALNAATSAFAKEAFDDATRSATQAQSAAEDARTTTSAKLEQIKAQRKKEERDALVKDILLRVQRNKDSLDDFARQVSAKQLESVDGLVRLAEKLMQEDKADLALVNAERADALVQQAVQYAKDVKTAEADVAENLKGIANVQVLTTTRGVLVRVTGDLFAAGRSDLGKEYAPTISKIAQAYRPYVTKYRVVVEGHTDRSGNAQTNLRLSKERAASVARLLTESLGAASAQVSSDGFGDTKPIPDVTPSNPKNRRVDIFLLTRERP